MVLGLAAEPLHRWLGHVTHRPRLSERGGLEMLTSRIQARNLTESNGARLAGAVSCVRDNVVSSRPDLRCPPAIPAIGGGGMGNRTAYKSPPPARRARLYDARLHERDASGIGFVADLDARPSRAMADRDQAKAAMVAIERALAAEGLELERWRTVPVDPEALGDQARASMPAIEQAVFRAPGVDDEEAERRCLRAGRRAVTDAHTAGAPLYLASCSTRTVTYKALCAADQLAAFYADLADERLRAPFVIFHQRYSTNTMPSWERAREGNLGAGHLAGEDGLDPEELLRPVLDPDGSDSAMLDNALELLVRGGRDIRHALAMLVPAAAERDPEASRELRDFYRYHACLTEPWDGPAGLVFTDGRVVGAALDRNGLRPLRYEVCEDGLVVCASEVGAIDLAGHGAVRRGRLGPGQMLCVDPSAGVGLQTDVDIKQALARSRP